jgi:predicted transcriptional regulator
MINSSLYGSAIRFISSRTSGNGIGVLYANANKRQSLTKAVAAQPASTQIHALLHSRNATVNENDTLQTVVSKMISQDVGTLAVLSNSGRVVGAVSENSLLNIHDSPQKIKAGQLADKSSVVMIEPTATINSIALTEALETASGRQLPLACQSSGEFLGLVFISDLVRVLAGECSFVRAMHDEYTGTAPIHDG